MMETEVTFSEQLDRLTCATLLTETIKYLIFHRYQTPFPFDQLKAEDERDKKAAQSERRSPRHRPPPMVVKKKRQLIADIEELLVNLNQAFTQTDVLEVLLLFGATIGNPKEKFLLRFPSFGERSETERMKAMCFAGKENGHSSRSKFVDKCCRKLARTLFTDPGLNEYGEIGCTSIYCFILAPRKTETNWLKPKHSFKVPKKGKSCVIKVHSSGGGDGDHEIRTSPEDDDEDMLWFQAPVVVKGYKDVYKETVKSSMWGK